MIDTVLLAGRMLRMTGILDWQVEVNRKFVLNEGSRK
jgi:hypothetical protein